MPNYLFTWDETTRYEVVIDAETIQQAHHIYDTQMFDDESVVDVVTHLTDGPHVEVI